MRRGVWVRVSVAVFAVLAALPALTSGADAALWVPPSRGARIAIVIDDVVDGPRLASFLTIPAPLTFAVLPFTATSAAASHRIAARGDQVIAHLPITLRRVGTSGWVLGRGASAECRGRSRSVGTMCRNITTLRGLEPPATAEEIEAAARQYVRKVSGVQRPSPATEEAFERAVREVAGCTEELLAQLPERRQPPPTLPPLRRISR